MSQISNPLNFFIVLTYMNSPHFLYTDNSVLHYIILLLQKNKNIPFFFFHATKLRFKSIVVHLLIEDIYLFIIDHL